VINDNNYILPYTSLKYIFSQFIYKVKNVDFVQILLVADVTLTPKLLRRHCNQSLFD